MIFYLYTFNKITSFLWKLNRYSYGVQFGSNCTALDQLKLNNFVECAIKNIIAEFRQPKRAAKQSPITIGTGSHACVEIETRATLFSS